MNIDDFVQNFVYSDITYDEIKCPINSSTNKCSIFVSPTTVLLKDKDILIIGDNRYDEKANKLIYVSNIDLYNNTFNLSYIETIPTQKIYIYLFTTTPDSNNNYYFGLNITFPTENINNSLFSTYNLLENYIHPPIITIDNGNIALKLTNKTTNNIEYKHFPINFSLNSKDNAKLETQENISKNMEGYKLYFHDQIKKYQDYYNEKLKILEEELKNKIQEKEIIVIQEKKDSNSMIFLIVIIVLIVLSIIGLLFYINKINNSNKKRNKRKYY
jgi:ATP-dependent Zn protease